MSALLFGVDGSEFVVSIWHKTNDVENQPLPEKSSRKERSALFAKRAAEKSGALFSRKERPKREILENLDSY